MDIAKLYTILDDYWQVTNDELLGNISAFLVSKIGFTKHHNEQ
jgi:hypothetical protein